MKSFPVPFNEEARISAVADVPGLTRENDLVFDAICRAAAALFGCPVAHISVIERDSQWYKSVVGMDLPEMPRQSSFCAHTIMSDAPMVVPDLSRDPKFAEHPMVAAGGPQARFYAGVPLVLSSGMRFGALCVLDLVPHPAPDGRQMEVLAALGVAVVAALERAPAAPAAPVPVCAASNFLTLVGHELRTPLTVTQGALRLMGARLQDPLLARLAQGAERSADHLTQLINTILNFSNAQTGELSLEEVPVLLGPLLEEVHRAHDPGPLDPGKDFAPPRCDVLGPVLMDAVHMRTCITSLVLNALLHGGAQIRLTAAQDAQGHVVISVHDTGTLDSHVDLAELYKPFIVGGALARRGAGGGLGLGLPLTRKLVELHGGEFEVLADAGGTTARIRLPKWRCAGVR